MTWTLFTALHGVGGLWRVFYSHCKTGLTDGILSEAMDLQKLDRRKRTDELTLTDI